MQPLTPRRRVRVVIAVAALLLVGGVAVALRAMSGSGSGETHTVIGAIVVGEMNTYTSLEEGDSCSGSGGYGDMQEGADVVIKNQDGKVLATGSLDEGTVESARERYTSSYEADKWAIKCGFGFAVHDVPDADFYSIEVSHRGAITKSKAEMKASGWLVTLSLGGD